MNRTTEDTTKETYTGGLLERLRTVTPHRTLSASEARYLAERQATL